MGRVLQGKLDLFAHELIRNLDILGEIGEGGAEAIKAHRKLRPVTFTHTNEQVVILCQG